MRSLLKDLAIAIKEKQEASLVVSRFRSVLKFSRTGDFPLFFNWHPLGFVHTKLDTVGSIGTLRFHIWPDGFRATQDPAWLVHNHIWELDSFVLVGSPLNQVFSVVPWEVEPSHRLYNVGYEGNSSVLRSTNQKVLCTLRDEAVHFAGSYYNVKLDTFHATLVPEQEFVATVVLTTNEQAVAPLVVGNLDGAKEYRYAREPVPIDFSNRLLKQVDDLIR